MEVIVVCLPFLASFQNHWKKERNKAPRFFNPLVPSLSFYFKQHLQGVWLFALLVPIMPSPHIRKLFFGWELIPRMVDPIFWQKARLYGIKLPLWSKNRVKKRYKLPLLYLERQGGWSMGETSE